MTTGMNVVELTHKQETALKQTAAALKSPVDLVVDKAHATFETVKSLEKEIVRLKEKMAAMSAASLAASAKEVNGMKLVVSKVEGVDAKSLRSMAESLRDKLGDAVVVLAVVNDGKAQLAAGVSKSLNARVKAGEVVSHVAQQMGGKGGGKPDLAMAGAPDVAKLDTALTGVEAFLQTK